MEIPMVCSPTGGGGAPPPTLELHEKLLKDVDDLQTPPRLGNITLDVSLSFANMPPSSYTTENICSLIKTHKHSNAYIYLHPKYSTPTPVDPSDVDAPSHLSLQKHQLKSCFATSNVLLSKEMTV